jgi:hypothetical protein
VGPDISETLLQYPVSVAEMQMEQFAQVADECSSFAVTTHGLSIDVGIALEAFPSLGDQTLALRVSADVVTDGITITGDVVAVRHEGTVMVVTNVALPLNSGLTRSVVAAAYANVAARL